MVVTKQADVCVGIAGERSQRCVENAQAFFVIAIKTEVKVYFIK